MKRKLIIKSFKLSAKSNDNVSKIIVVGYNTTKVNGRYIEKLGVCSRHGRKGMLYFFNLSRIGFWLNRGAVLKPRISWMLGVLGKGYSRDA